MALINLQLGKNNVETIFMMAREENSYISSSVVKQIAPYGGDVSRLVPKVVSRALEKKFRK
jgi:pantetheine-phosphate adenylyltransferase